MNKIFYSPTTERLYEQRGNEYSMGCSYLTDCRTSIPEANIKSLPRDAFEIIPTIPEAYPFLVNTSSWHGDVENCYRVVNSDFFYYASKLGHIPTKITEQEHKQAIMRRQDIKKQV